ncbi:hypothetical protein, partial [Methylobacterium sp. WL2]|uniref:hypothetical protein n=1 Tax=Methylobacterium sp. WL2 TaxID=2603902 RepID=UPI0011CB3FEC
MSRTYYPWGEPSPKLREARLLIISDDQREIMRSFDMSQYAKTILDHFSKRSRPGIDELKLALMLVILIKYSGVRPKYAAGSESFVSPHFLTFALQNVPEGMGQAGEE